MSRSHHASRSVAVWIVFSSLFVFALDRLTKQYALSSLHEPITVLPGFLDFFFVMNPNFFFFLPVPQQFMIPIIFALLIILLWVAWEEYWSRHLAHVVCLSFIFVGAISNLIDRFLYGFVIDFIRIPFWSVFNLADLSIIGGACALLFFAFRQRKQLSYTPPEREI